MSKSISRTKITALVAGITTTLACGSSAQIGNNSPHSFPQESWPKQQTEADKPVPIDLQTPTGALSEYLAIALSGSPNTRAAFELWRAARLQIRPAERLPEPTISFGYYLRSVETRVGPQRYKVGISQTFPWPGKLSSGANAAAENAAAAALLVDVNVLSVKRDVAQAYWKLWLIGETNKLMSEHDVILEALAGAVRGRLRTGVATLAELNQVELNIARHHDHGGQHKQSAYKASAILRAVIGGAPNTAVLPVTDGPQDGTPENSEEQLLGISRSHPMVEKFAHLAASERHRAKAEKSTGYPRFTVGLSIVGTGEAIAPMDDSGKDAVVLSAGLSLPLWRGTYDDAKKSAMAVARAHEAMRDAGIRKLEAMLISTLADVRDAQRKIYLYEKTLIPQAESTFQAVLGGYQIGRSTVAAVILAQRDLIELRLEHASARARRAISWSELEYVVGRELKSKGPNHE